MHNLRLDSIADRKARKLHNRLASAMRIDIETWLRHTLRSLGRVCYIRSQVAHVHVNFYEHPRNSWGCCEVWKQKTQVRNAPLFWRYSFGLTLLYER